MEEVRPFGRGTLMADDATRERDERASRGRGPHGADASHQGWRRVTGLARHVAVAALSLGSLTASVGHVAAVDQPAVPRAVISLGDSYSSGLGAGGHTGECDRAPEAWGLTIFGDAVEDRTLLACSGAGIAEVAGQVEQLAALPDEAGGRLITVTVGGNDIGFAEELVRCFTPFVSCVDRERVIAGRISRLREPLAELYRSITDAAPGDEVIVGGYPLLVPDPGVRDRCRALTPLLSDAERRMIRRLGAALNDVVDSAAAEAGVRSAAGELEGAFAGHEACANGPSDWLNGLKLSLGSDDNPPRGRWDLAAAFVEESFHPNLAGQSGYAAVFEELWLDG